MTWRSRSAPATAERIDADLHEVVTGATPRRAITRVFMSVGVAFEDLAVAAALEANADAG